MVTASFNCSLDNLLLSVRGLRCFVDGYDLKIQLSLVHRFGVRLLQEQAFYGTVPNLQSQFNISQI